MQLGMIGLGRMGGNMVQRLMQQGHECLVYDLDPEARESAAAQGARACDSLEALMAQLERPRVVWLMLPAAVVDPVLQDLRPLLSPDDVVVDGGNTCWRDDLRRAHELSAAGVDYVDVGTSGGVRGLERGYCLMVGGPATAFRRIEPLLMALAPGAAAAPPTPGRRLGGTAEQGYLHCGGPGAGHFVKMVHNAIEYGIMAAYAEGFNLLVRAGPDAGHENAVPLESPEVYGYDFDVAEIAELWRRGSVIGSWLLDLTAQAMQQDPRLEGFTGSVSDSGEGRWAMGAAVELGVPAPVLSAALFGRFESRDGARFALQMLSAMRHGFGGHTEAPAVLDQADESLKSLRPDQKRPSSSGTAQRNSNAGASRSDSE